MPATDTFTCSDHGYPVEMTVEPLDPEKGRWSSEAWHCTACFNNYPLEKQRRIRTAQQAREVVRATQPAPRWIVCRPVVVWWKPWTWRLG